MSGIPVSFEAEILNSERKEYEKDGTKKVYLNCTVYSPYTGAVATLSVSDEEVFKEIEALKRCDCDFSADYNPTYKNLRVVSVCEHID